MRDCKTPVRDPDTRVGACLQDPCGLTRVAHADTAGELLGKPASNRFPVQRIIIDSRQPL